MLLAIDERQVNVGKIGSILSHDVILGKVLATTDEEHLSS